MTFSLYNTLARKKQIFKPIKEGEVRMYSCGPTVYDYAHIGNFRAYIVADVLKRWLLARGYKVSHIMNITDVDDKTIKGSIGQNISLREYTEKYANAFFEDVRTLSILPADVYPRATEYIDEMVEMVQALLKKGYAYKSEDGSVYYDISKFHGYGKLSKLKLEGLKAGARVSQDTYDKDEAQDFALWKAWTVEDGDVGWRTEIGKGRPGWHIECSVMSQKNLGAGFDIHTGGVDLIFPHHENEIAQSEAATGKKMVNWWVHNEHLLVEGKKMSKSLGNFYTLHQIVEKGYSPKAIRYILLATHYRQKLNFTFESLEAARNSVNRILDFMDMLDGVAEEKSGPGTAELVLHYRKKFEEAMDSDLNTPLALAAVFGFIKEVNVLNEKKVLGRPDAEEARMLMLDFDRVLGILDRDKVATDIDEGIERLVQEREEARKNRDFKKSDEIRAKLKEMGVILEDTAAGVKWKIRKE